MDTIEKVNQMIENDPCWITDKKPDNVGYYLVTATSEEKHDGQKFVTISWYGHDGWYKGYNVFAWMHLPPVYIAPEGTKEKRCKNCFHFTNGSCMVCSHDSEGKKTMVSSTDPLFGCKHWKERENE